VLDAALLMPSFCKQKMRRFCKHSALLHLPQNSTYGRFSQGYKRTQSLQENWPDLVGVAPDLGELGQKPVGGGQNDGEEEMDPETGKYPPQNTRFEHSTQQLPPAFSSIS
jgi:hypothetical protein